MDNNLLNKVSIAQKIEAKINRWDTIKLKTFFPVEAINRGRDILQKGKNSLVILLLEY